MGISTQPDPSALDPVPRHRPRYRWRSWLIVHLPMPLAVRVPMGKRDCGQHEWRRYDEDTDVCYHCLAGERPHQPIDVPIDHEFRVGLVRWAEDGGEGAVRMVEKFHAHDRELGRPRWRPPAELAATPPTAKGTSVRPAIIDDRCRPSNSSSSPERVSTT